MRRIPITNHGGLDETRVARIQDMVAEHRSLDQIFVWGRSQAPPVQPHDVVKQDEFTHDVLVPLPDGTWIVYGTT